MNKYLSSFIFFKINFIKKKIRIDKILSFYVIYLSRNFIINLIKKNNLYLNNELFINFNFKNFLIFFVKIFVINFLNKFIPIIIKKNINILYEDNFLLIIEKPFNFLIHSNFYNLNNNLIESLLYFYGKKILLLLRYGIFHRLDKDTTGLMLIFKSNFVYLNLLRQFKYNLFNKYYFSLNYGKRYFSKKIIGYINNFYKKTKFKNNFYSISNFIYFKCLLYKNKKYFYIKSNLVTGRTNQLRLQFNSLGVPILGDKLSYTFFKIKDFAINRHILHCYNIVFFHPIYSKIFNFKNSISKDLLIFLKLLFRDGGI